VARRGPGGPALVFIQKRSRAASSVWARSSSLRRRAPRNTRLDCKNTKSSLASFRLDIRHMQSINQ
jgi:hypothetical protein